MHGIWHYRHLILYKAWADFQADSRNNHLGMVWWILDPIINTAIYYLVFGLFLGRAQSDFVPFLVVGIVGWQWFQGSIVPASQAIWKSAATFRRVAVPKSIFPTTRILTAFYRYLFASLVVITVLLMYGFFPNLYWFYFIIPMIIQVLLLTCICLITASMVPFYPDLANFVQYLLRIGFYMSGVLYHLDDLPEKVQFYLRFNPMVHILNAYRDALMYSSPLDWRPLVFIALCSLVGIVFGLFLIRKFDGVYAKRIQA